MKLDFICVLEYYFFGHKTIIHWVPKSEKYKLGVQILQDVIQMKSTLQLNNITSKILTNFWYQWKVISQRWDWSEEYEHETHASSITLIVNENHKKEHKHLWRR